MENKPRFIQELPKVKEEELKKVEEKIEKPQEQQPNQEPIVQEDPKQKPVVIDRLGRF